MCSMAEVDKGRALSTLERSHALSSSERLRMARFLAQNATGADRQRLTNIRADERNSWVRHALDQALKRSEKGQPVPPISAIDEVIGTPIDSRLYEDVRAQVIEETSALFLHELRPLVGLLEDAADAEIHCYPRSQTKTSLDRVKSFLGAIDRLRTASAAPAIQEFDLTDLVVGVAADEAAQGRATLDIMNAAEGAAGDPANDAEQVPQQTVIRLSFARREPVITTGDPTLVKLAAANAVRNAIEAVLEAEEGGRSEVILNWGVTDADSWIVVLDEGCGLPQGWDRLTEPGTSTKSKSEDHLGMGLPIAQRAIESMSGSLRLSPRSGAGVSCEIRWPCGV